MLQRSALMSRDPAVVHGFTTRHGGVSTGPLESLNLAQRPGESEAALAENQLMFPDASTLANLQSWGNLDEDEEALFDEEFARITGA